MTFARDSIWTHEFHSCERFTYMISFMIYYWLKYVASDSIRRVTRVRLWEESLDKGDWITIVRALHATI